MALVAHVLHQPIPLLMDMDAQELVDWGNEAEKLMERLYSDGKK